MASIAQDYSFYVGSIDKPTRATRYTGNSLWSIVAMDEGTNLFIQDGNYRLGIVNERGVIFIVAGTRDESSVQLLLGSLPVKVPMRTSVHFECEPNRYIYIQELK